jgi:hypothetical protein
MPTVLSEIDQSDRTVLSWGAVIAGAITSAALTVFLMAFGIGLGFSIVSPWSDQGVSATTFHVAAGVYLVCVAMLASAVGGYLAGRLRMKWVDVHDDEIYFRDTAHGLVTWALATVLTAAVLGGATTHILAAASAGSIPATAGAAGAAAMNPANSSIDALLRTDPSAAGQVSGPGAPAASASTTDRTATRAELGRLLAPALRKGGEVSAADRAYAAKIVSARTGLSQADAEARVTQVVTQAKQTADETRKATATLMLWLGGSMLAGAVAAMLGATEGGLLRDSKWYEPGWRATIVRRHY